MHTLHSHTRKVDDDDEIVMTKTIIWCIFSAKVEWQQLERSRTHSAWHLCRSVKNAADTRLSHMYDDKHSYRSYKKRIIIEVHNLERETKTTTSLFTSFEAYTLKNNHWVRETAETSVLVWSHPLPRPNALRFQCILSGCKSSSWN